MFIVNSETLARLYHLLVYEFFCRGVQGEETLMVERESKAHCLSNLADEKWQVAFFQSFFMILRSRGLFGERLMSFGPVSSFKFLYFHKRTGIRKKGMWCENENQVFKEKEAFSLFLPFLRMRGCLVVSALYFSVASLWPVPGI